MKSSPLGTPTSRAEVTNVSRHGFWILLDDREYFLAFGALPWRRPRGSGEWGGGGVLEN